jgi:hypothetical protein
MSVMNSGRGIAADTTANGYMDSLEEGLEKGMEKGRTEIIFMKSGRSHMIGPP